MTIYVGSIDFYDGDFELNNIEAESIIDAERKLRAYVLKSYGRHLKEIDHIAVQSLSYVARKIAEMDL